MYFWNSIASKIQRFRISDISITVPEPGLYPELLKQWLLCQVNERNVSERETVAVNTLLSGNIEIFLAPFQR